MPDVLSPYHIVKFENAIKEGSHLPHLHKNVFVALNLDLANSFFKELHLAKSRFSSYLYVDIINTQVTSCQLVNCESLELRFSTLCRQIDVAFCTKHRSGRKRAQFAKKVQKVAIC